MTTFNRMQTVKRRFFAMRNGIIADTLRRAGSPHRIIFGLNLPQLVEIADEFGPDADLAQALWDNDTTRESRLLAPMLMPRDTFTHEHARRWISTLQSTEEADILCHRLLRHTPYAWTLAEELATDPAPIARYTALRLAANKMYTEPERARAILKTVPDDPSTAQLQQLIQQETDYLTAE